jgi:hypothetical protein
MQDILRSVIEMRKDVIIGIGLIIIFVVFFIIFLPGQIHTIPVNKTEQITTVTREQPTPLPGMRSGAAIGKLSHNLVLNSSLSLNEATTKAEKRILVYKTVPPVVNKEATLALAKKFNVTGKMMGDTTIQSDNLATYVEIEKESGYTSYANTDHSDETNSVFIPADLTSDKEAIKIATKFLKDRDLFPEDAVPVEVEHIKTERLNNKDNTKIVVWEKLAVWFGGNLDNVKVHGRSIRVVVNADGEIIEYDANWRNYKPYQEYPVKTAKDAFGELESRGVAVGMNEPESVSIDQVELAYNSLPGAYVENYLEPVYIFKGHAMVKGESIMSISEYVPALTDEAVNSLSS